MKYNQSRTLISDSYQDDESKSTALSKFSTRTLLIPLIAPLAFFDLFAVSKFRNKVKVRFIPPDESGQWKRINKDEISAKELTKYLNDGQRNEQKVNSKIFEFWKNTLSGKIQVNSFDGEEASSYEECPQCHFFTFHIPYIKTITAATYSNSGTGIEKQDCRNCRYEIELGKVTIPKKSEAVPPDLRVHPALPVRPDHREEVSEADQVEVAEPEADGNLCK